MVTNKMARRVFAKESYLPWKSLFTWRVPEQGFEWVHQEDDPDQILVPCNVSIAATAAANAKLPAREYLPLRDHTGLCRTFADVPLSREGVLQFANRYGAVTTQFLVSLRPCRDQRDMGFSLEKAGRYAWWRSQIVTMRRAIMLWDRAQGGDRALLSRFIDFKLDSEGGGFQYRSHPELSEKDEQARGPEDEEITSFRFRLNDLRKEWQELLKPNDVVTAARFLVKRMIEEQLSKGASAKVALLAENRGMTFGFVPDDLLKAMWLQFALGASEGKKYRSCAVCGTWYELSPDTARTTRLFCSDSCKSRGYRQKQDRARQLFSEKNTFRQIAKELGSDVATVKRWITGKKE
jgi:hypothetical protein